MAIARRSIDGHAIILKLSAGLINVVDLVSEMPEVASIAVTLLVPVPGQLKQGGRPVFCGLNVLTGGEKDEGKASVFVLDSPGFDESKDLAIEVETFFEIVNPNHGMKVSHCIFLILATA